MINIKCKNCGTELDYCVTAIIHPDQDTSKFIFQIPEYYKGYLAYPVCQKCQCPIDYAELPLYAFLEWMNRLDELHTDRSLIGKSLIRYFHLDELLVGDKNENG